MENNRNIMLTEENFLTILFKIGFREKEEHEIVFSSFEEKLEYRKGEKRFLQHNDGKGNVTITYNIREVLFYYSAWEEERKSYLTSLTLDNMKNIFEALNVEYKHELRKLKIEELLK